LKEKIMQTLPMFSVPLIHHRIENWQTNKKRIKGALPNVTDEICKSHGQAYTDFFEQQSKKELPSYSDVVFEVIDPLLRVFADGVPMNFTEMWYQTSIRGGAHGIHNHGTIGWSAVIYVDFDIEHHTPTMFYSPFDNFWNGEVQVYSPTVQEGDMIIFPSVIKHEALVNDSDVRRTIISFNIAGCPEIVKKTLFGS
jgi:hypothetical protein